MAKFYGTGILTGKSGNKVYAVRFGETIERQYQPVVANPSTVSQVEARAKLKLLSQMSAVLGRVIAMPRMGAVSPRNLFTKVNYPNMSYSGGEASIGIDRMQLTRSDVFMMQPAATLSGANMTVVIDGGAGLDVSRVVYVVLRRGDDGKVRLAATQVVEKITDPTFSATFSDMPTGEGVTSRIVVLAYGVRDNTETARAIFANMEWKSAQAVAGLIATRTLLDRDVTLTETRTAYFTT